MNKNIDSKNSVTLNNDSHYVLKCPVCSKCVKIHIKGESTIKILGTCVDGIILSRMNIAYDFKCPACNTTMIHYRDTINRISSILESIMDDKIMVHTYIPPMYKGVKVINDMLVDEYDYPSLVLISEESEAWVEQINLIKVIIESSPFAKMFEIHTHMSEIKGGCFIRLNETNFNEYFVSLHLGMHEFIRISEFYFFDGIDYIASQLEDIYNFDHKDEK